ncbi:ABC transporter transmembrane domain-containing protein, partial [Vibrio sp. 2304]|uniref:ABC transporter transmembrane domain-containing protein n=1 Tax=Vibrio sp. 2304 TaxID=3074601 RepID=UPI0029647C0F
MKKYILNHKFLLSLSLIFVIVISIVEAYQAILFKTIVDTAAGTYSYEISTLILFSILFLAAVFLSETLSKASNAALNAAVMRDYKQSIIKSFLSIDTQSKLSSSELISILNNDIKVIEDNYLNSIINIAKDIFLFIISLYLLLRINIYLTLSIFIFGWLPVVIPQLSNKRNQALKGKYL